MVIAAVRTRYVDWSVANVSNYKCTSSYFVFLLWVVPHFPSSLLSPPHPPFFSFLLLPQLSDRNLKLNLVVACHQTGIG